MQRNQHRPKRSENRKKPPARKTTDQPKELSAEEAHPAESYFAEMKRKWEQQNASTQ